MQKKRGILLLLLLSMLLSGSSPHFQAEPTQITIRAVPGLQFDLVRFKVKPGAIVKLIFTNHDDMSHNLVITQPATRKEVVNMAMEMGEKGQARNFIPDSPKVLWSIPVLAPGESKTITFTVPNTEGIYPYVCTYPGHGFVMYGAMYVTNGDMPPISQDQHIEASRRNTEGGAKPGQDHAVTGVENTKAGHPYKPVAPYMYRVFIDGAGPAAIAVNLPNYLSYCWDAGACRLRYAWEGEFLDLTDFWKGHQDAHAKVMGKIFYRDKSAFPIRIGALERIPVPKFKGYRLINRYPEFHYELDGVEVFETIYPKKDGTGLIRNFSIPQCDKAIWFIFDPADGVEYRTEKGRVMQSKTKLSPAEARKFSIIMTKRKGPKL